MKAVAVICFITSLVLSIFFVYMLLQHLQKHTKQDLSVQLLDFFEEKDMVLAFLLAIMFFGFGGIIYLRS